MDKIICFLCKKEKAINNSHIIPKFVFNFLKKSGVGRLRSTENINKPIEDGTKKPFLCQNCEKKFNLSETDFCNKIFYPIINQKKESFEYDTSFKYFIISLFWRIIKDTLNNKGLCKKLEEIENEYSNLLNFNTPLFKYANLHCFIGVDIIQEIKYEPLIYYMARAVDSAIFVNNEDEIEFIYVKIPRFIFILPISNNIKDHELINTKINDQGEYFLSNAIISSDIIGSSIISQADYFWAENQKKSVIQKKKTKELTERRKEDLKKNDLGKLNKYIHKK